MGQLSRACTAVAESITGLKSEHARARVDALASRIEASAKRLCEELGLEDDEIDQVEGCIWALSSGMLSESEEVATTQFAGVLRALLCLAQGRMRTRQEMLPFLRDVAASAQFMEEHVQQPVQETPTVGADHADQRSGGTTGSGSVDATLQAGNPPSRDPVEADVPEDWEVVSTAPRVWRSRAFRSRINQERTGDWCQEALVMAQPLEGGTGYIVQGKLGNGECQAVLRGAARSDPEAAFESLKQQIALCPDEGAVPAKSFVRERLEKRLWPDMVTLANKVPVGLPRYAASAWWSKERGSVMTTPLMATRRAALEALVHRIRSERQPEEEQASAKGPDVLRRLVARGIKPITCRVLGKDGEQWWYEMTWNLPDGNVASVKSDVKPGKWAAMESLFEKVDAAESAAELDWKKVATRGLTVKALGEVAHVSFETAPAIGKVPSGMVVCKVAMTRGAVARGEPSLGKLQAVQSATGAMEKLALRMGNTAVKNKADAARSLRESLAAGRSRWIERRAQLMKIEGAAQEHKAELRDLGWLIALSEPGRAGEVPPHEAERLLRKVAGDSLGGGSKVSTLSFEFLARSLRSMSTSGVVVAGGIATVTREFTELCSAMGSDERTMLKELGDRNLIKAKAGSLWRFSLAGEQLATKYVDNSLVSGMAKLGTKLKKG